ncbi:MAG: glycosyltransferase family 4 protein [Hasllibacter sp.]
MRIAQIAPLAESVPPKFYGGTERIVSYLTEALVEDGHEVTLFASGDSVTRAELASPVPAALRLRTDPPVLDAGPYHMMMLDALRARADEFDVVHFHLDVMPLPLVRALPCPSVFTLHGRQDLPDLWPCYDYFREVPFVSISDHQRRPVPDARNWAATIHHGLPPDLLPFSERSEGYLAFLGRISPEKRPDRAIRVAAATGRELRIAAKVDRVDRAYWEEEIAPLIAMHDNVHYIGEVDERQKARFLAGADALLFPIDWPEPFGLVMIEAMSAGTPVLAMRCGSVPEVIDHGRSGWIHDDVDGMIETVRARLDGLPRRTVRETFEARFTAARMAGDYVALYRRLIAGRARPGAAADLEPAVVAAE